MAKTKTKQPKDDLIDQLLDDANVIADDSQIVDQNDDLDLEGATVAAPRGAPVGLAVDEERVDGTAVRNNLVWDQLANDLESEDAGGGEIAFETVEPPDIDSIPAGDGEEPAFQMDRAMSQERGSGLNPFEFPFTPETPENEWDGSLSIAGVPKEKAPDAPGSPRFESAEGHEHEATRPVFSRSSVDGTAASTNASTLGAGSNSRRSDSEKTVAADGFANRKKAGGDPQEKVVIGSLRGNRGGNVMTSMDASLAQAENLKIAQHRILEIENENDRLRAENEEVSSAAEIIRHRLEELTSRITSLEKEKSEIQESASNEIMILKGNLQYKESEVAKARLKVDELDSRLRNDFKKIRVKERELENRLELARAEKSALVRAKDEKNLELKRKVDQLQSEIDNYRDKCLELNKTIEAHQEQFRRTVRALRLALANLEAKDEHTVVPLKKAD